MKLFKKILNILDIKPKILIAICVSECRLNRIDVLKEVGNDVINDLLELGVINAKNDVVLGEYTGLGTMCVEDDMLTLRKYNSKLLNTCYKYLYKLLLGKTITKNTLSIEFRQSYGLSVVKNNNHILKVYVNNDGTVDFSYSNANTYYQYMHNIKEHISKHQLSNKIKSMHSNTESTNKELHYVNCDFYNYSLTRWLSAITNKHSDIKEYKVIGLEFIDSEFYLKVLTPSKDHIPYNPHIDNGGVCFYINNPITIVRDTNK